jgi:arsenite methyltransferase
MDSSDIYQLVQDRYGKYATSYDNELNLETNNMIAKAFGYSIEELTSIPQGANLGVSCGNPLATANLEEVRHASSCNYLRGRKLRLIKLQGNVVIDLGSGAGFDIFLAAQKVGSSGKAIGVDMNKVSIRPYPFIIDSQYVFQDMLELARKNSTKSNASNVSFVEASITSIPLPPATADCIISNCVINLVPKDDKPLVFQEIFRLLKPGGRVSISDILAKKQLPVDIRRDMALYVGCIAGASLVNEYETYLKEAGFESWFTRHLEL